MLVFILLFSLLLREITCDGVVSREKDDQKERSDGHIWNMDHRRFIEDLEDNEWHVAHLKSIDLSRRSECAGDSLQDKYRKALKNDGSLVKFVSADAMPINETDLEKKEKCQVPTNYTIFVKNVHHKLSDEQNSTSTTKLVKEATNNVSNTVKSFENGTIEKEIYTATTANVKISLEKDGNKTDSRRGSEYQISSAEYYDEVTDFDETWCPNDIQVIDLEIDQVKSYDIVCEQLVQWHSLN